MKATAGSRQGAYLDINKELVVSPRAHRVYRVSAYTSTALFVGLVSVLVEGGVPASMAPFARTFLFFGVIGAGITLVGMECFLFRFDGSHPLKQIAWFCVMIFPLLGPALYCLIVYSRSDVVRNAYGKAAVGASGV
jgi:hypothetical protein